MAVNGYSIRVMYVVWEGYNNQAMNHLVKQAKTGVSPSLLQRSPSKFFNHLSYTSLFIEVTGCLASSSSLDLFDLGYSHFRVPFQDSQSIF